jgi:hypothetical protein
MNNKRLFSIILVVFIDLLNQRAHQSRAQSLHPER